ncbi:hypothetical protein [Corynebacterium sp.]|uniref:hypothetical protein n=1 Tax=Corynebacterium sp. TaxID=1720 RepID=UPI0026DAA250|nr:hypothetical protein [Corynebacterium sp.]MDO5031204.1 hypothetical protein [Corynebacterium sp.]
MAITEALIIIAVLLVSFLPLIAIMAWLFMLTKRLNEIKRGLHNAGLLPPDAPR